MADLIEFAVENAKKPPRRPHQKQGGNGGGGNKREQQARFADYAIIGNAFYQIKRIKAEGEYIDAEIPLCDFTAEILEESTQDTGLEDKAYLKIRVKRQDSPHFLPITEIPATKFFSSACNWVNEYFGSTLFIYPGATKRDHLRACIQQFSRLNGDIPKRYVYTYTGWKRIDDRWHYLSNQGSLNENGLSDSINVELGAGHMANYQLPAPLAKAQLQAAINAALLLLKVCPAKPFIGAALLATVARAPLGECHPIDFAVFIHGLTGTRKSSLTAVALAFFGSFTGNSFPGNWSDSDSDLEAKAFQAKDSLFVVDDFKPSVNQAEASKLHSKAERFIRNTGNLAGRGRRNTDMSAKSAPYNRSMTIITGEDLPKGQSLLGRLLILELAQGDIDLSLLTQLQRNAREGLFSGLMAAYIQYLAPNIEGMKKTFPDLVRQYRDEALQHNFASSHPRASEIYANLVAGAEIFIDFFYEQGGKGERELSESIALLSDIQSHLKQVFSAQAMYISEQDECERFMNLLRALFSSGNGHLADSLKQGPPDTRPHSWGWRKNEIKGIEATFDEYSPTGDRIGWLSAKKREVWLDQDACFARVQTLARNQGDPFIVTAATLWRRMGDRGLIVQFEDRGNGAKQWTVKRAIDGVKKRVMALSADVVEGGLENQG